MEQYFHKQPYEIDGVIQNKWFFVETYLGEDPEGGHRVRLDVVKVRADKVEELSEKYLFVSMLPDGIPTLRLK